MKQAGTAAAAQSAHQAAQKVPTHQPNNHDHDTLTVVGQDYSLWTSRAFTPFVDEDNVIPGNLTTGQNNPKFIKICACYKIFIKHPFCEMFAYR